MILLWLALFVIFIITLVLVYQTDFFGFGKKNKWKCAENGCEININGNYSNKHDCDITCTSNKNDNETLSELNSNNNIVSQQSDNDEKDKYNAWACTNNYNCVKAEQGFTSEEICKQNCQNSYSNSNYYPQSKVPYYYYRAPYINYKPRWNHRRHRHRSPHRRNIPHHGKKK